RFPLSIMGTLHSSLMDAYRRATLPPPVMTTPPDLSRLHPGDRVQDSFLVLEVETRRGDYPHTVLTLGNSSGAIPTAPFWAEDLAGIAGIARRSVVQVEGEVALYR